MFPLPWPLFEGAFAGAAVAPHWNRIVHGAASVERAQVYLLPRVGRQVFPLAWFGLPDVGWRF